MIMNRKTYICFFMCLIFVNIDAFVISKKLPNEVSQSNGTMEVNPSQSTSKSVPTQVLIVKSTEMPKIISTNNENNTKSVDENIDQYQSSSSSSSENLDDEDGDVYEKVEEGSGIKLNVYEEQHEQQQFLTKMNEELLNEDYVIIL